MNNSNYSITDLSQNQATEACIGDILRLSSNDDFKSLIFDSFTCNNPFKDLLPDECMTQIEDSLNRMLFIDHKISLDNVMHDEHLNPEEDVSYTNFIDFIVANVTESDMRSHFNIGGPFEDSKRKLFVAKKMVRSIVAKIIFMSGYVQDISELLSTIDILYVSNGYYLQRNKTITKHASYRPIRTLRTAHGVIHIKNEICKVAEYLNISKYSIGVQPVSYLLINDVEIRRYSEVIEDSVRFIKNIVFRGVEPMVLHRKGCVYVACATIDELYNAMVRDNFLNDKSKTLSAKKFRKDVGIGDSSYKKIDGVGYKMREFIFVEDHIGSDTPSKDAQRRELILQQKYNKVK